MQQTSIEFQFQDVMQRPHVARAVSNGGHDWHLSTTIDGHVFTKRCSNWERVERTLSWLRRHAHEPLSEDAGGVGDQSSAERRPPEWPRTMVAVLVAAVWLGSGQASAQSVPPYSEPVTAFIAATDDYVKMHRRLEQHVGTFDISTPIDSINRLIEQLAAAIRAERPHAAQGDLFAPAVAVELRARIASALRDHGFTADDVRVAGAVDRIDYSRVHLRINDSFPWVLGVAMFPCVINALPPLPPELQYRIVGEDLVLIDLHASVIVDILPSALPSETALDIRR